MSIFSQLKQDQSKIAEGVWAEDILDSGELRLRIRPADRTNKQYKALFERLTRPYRALLERGKPLPADKGDLIWAEVISETLVTDAQVLVRVVDGEDERYEFQPGIDVDAEGKPVPYSREYLRKLLTLPEGIGKGLQDRILQRAYDEARFAAETKDADLKA
jgi:hypothetical protein